MVAGAGCVMPNAAAVAGLGRNFAAHVVGLARPAPPPGALAAVLCLSKIMLSKQYNYYTVSERRFLGKLPKLYRLDSIIPTKKYKIILLWIVSWFLGSEVSKLYYLGSIISAHYYIVWTV